MMTVYKMHWLKRYDQNVDFYTLLLNNEEIRAKFANVFMDEVYRILRDSTPPTTINYADFIGNAYVSEVAEAPTPYGKDKKINRRNLYG